METTQQTTGPRMSGGEDENADAIRKVRALIMIEPDVYDVMALSWVACKQRWLYLIKTPFATWPKFVVGYTDDGNTDPEILFRCGREANAWEEFNNHNFGDQL
jgi:hypothetical protein